MRIASHAVIIADLNVLSRNEGEYRYADRLLGAVDAPPRPLCTYNQCYRAPIARPLEPPL
jgi:hypothetical protein